MAPPQTVANAAACCASCKAHSNCTHWIYGPGDPAGNCWVVKDVLGLKQASARTVGGKDMIGGETIAFATQASSKLYGRGAGPGDDHTLTATSVSPFVENRQAYTPYFYSTDGYSALGVVESWATTGSGKTNYFPAGYASDGSKITWSPAKGAFEIYFMPAASLDSGTAAYYKLTGTPAVPPLYAFGFIASRWGWENRSYIEYVLKAFR